MTRTIAIDLPALCEGNRHQVNVPLFHEALSDISTLKNVELLISDGDRELLAANGDYAFTGKVWQMLSNVSLKPYSLNDRKDDLTHKPNIIVDSFAQEMKEAIYLQLCCMHTIGNMLEAVIQNEGELKAWTARCQPHLDQKKHMAQSRNSSMGEVSPFTSYFKYGKEYADSLLQQAYMQSEDDAEFPHYLYTWDARAGLFVEFRHENHTGDSQHNYHGRDMSQAEYGRVPQHIRDKYHQ